MVFDFLDDDDIVRPWNCKDLARRQNLHRRCKKFWPLEICEIKGPHPPDVIGRESLQAREGGLNVGSHPADRQMRSDLSLGDPALDLREKRSVGLLPNWVGDGF